MSSPTKRSWASIYVEDHKFKEGHILIISQTTWSETSTLLHDRFPFGFETDLGRDGKDKVMEEERTEFSASIGVSEEKTPDLKGLIEQLLQDRQHNLEVIQQLKLEKEEMMRAHNTEFGAKDLTSLTGKVSVAEKDLHILDTSGLKLGEEKPSLDDDRILLQNPAKPSPILVSLKPEPSSPVTPQAPLVDSTNESPGSSCVEGQASDADGHLGLLPTRSCPRQVGIATIRVQLLSFSKSNIEHDSEDSTSVDNDGPEESDGPQREEICDNGGSSGGGDERSGDNGQSSGPSGNPKRLQDVGDGNNGPHGNRRKRRRLNPPPSTKPVQRFACPYQAYEPFQPCFRQGPSNPRGGCDGIHRLK